MAVRSRGFDRREVQPPIEERENAGGSGRHGLHLRGNVQATGVVYRGRDGHSSEDIVHGSVEEQRYWDVKRCGITLIEVYTGRRNKRGLTRNDRVLLRLCEKFESHADVTLGKMCAQMNLSSSGSNQGSFLAVVRELFRPGATISRVVCFFTFSAYLARHCALQRELYPLVNEIIQWQARFIDEEVGRYLAEEGGMDALRKYLEAGNYEKSWITGSALWKIFCLAVAGTVIAMSGRI